MNYIAPDFDSKKDDKPPRNVLTQDYDIYLDWLDKNKLKGATREAVCPVCGHDLTAHYQMIDRDGELIDPKPCPCVECSDDGCEFTI